jgi:hypothetical protein
VGVAGLDCGLLSTRFRGDLGEVFQHIRSGVPCVDNLVNGKPSGV